MYETMHIMADCTHPSAVILQPRRWNVFVWLFVTYMESPDPFLLKARPYSIGHARASKVEFESLPEW